MSDADLASGDAKKSWKIQWLTQKLENVELASTDRQRAMEEEMALLRARHRDGLQRIRELEETLNRAELSVGSGRRSGQSGYQGSRHMETERERTARRQSGAAWDSDPRQGKLQRDLESLLAKVEQLLREVGDDTSADSRVMEEIEQERRALLEELLDVEQAVKEKRRRAQKEAAARRGKNSKLRADVQRGRDELEGHAEGAAVLELESNILRLEDDLREAEEDLSAAEDDKAALGDELAELESEHEALKDELAATKVMLTRATAERA